MHSLTVPWSYTLVSGGHARYTVYEQTVRPGEQTVWPGETSGSGCGPGPEQQPWSCSPGSDLAIDPGREMVTEWREAGLHGSWRLGS